jgi:hypothetical protein
VRGPPPDQNGPDDGTPRDGTPRGGVGLALVLAAAGLPGLFPWFLGRPDPVALLAWLALVAPAVGVAAGAHLARVWPTAWSVPGLWAVLLVSVDLASARHVPSPTWAMAVVAGLFLVGVGIGRRSGTRAPTAAALLLLVTLLLTALPHQAGLGERGAGWAGLHPALARVFLDASPLVLVLECGGLDWTHVQPDVYTRGGVEWVQRRPHAGILAGTVVLLVGSLAAHLGRRRARRPGLDAG